MAVPHTYGGRGPLQVAITALYCAIATVLVALRLWHRSKAPKYANWALIWTIVVWAMGIFQLTFLGISVSYGMGQRGANLTHEQIKLALMWFWADLVVAIICLGIGKASVVAFLLELQGPTYKKMRWCLLAVAIVNAIVSIITPFIAMFQCSPPRKLWDPTVSGSCNYMENAIMAYVQSAINAGTAFGLALYPVFIVWDLQMSKRLKFGICILLGIGVFMGICAILKAVQLKAIGSTNDPTWFLHALLMWSSTEMWVTIIIPSIPPLWPFFRQLWQNTTDQVFSRRRTPGQTTNKNMQLKDFAKGNAYGTEHRTQVTGTAQTDFQQLPSRSESREAMLPEDGILVTKDVSVSPHLNERASFPEAVVKPGQPMGLPRF